MKTELETECLSTLFSQKRQAQSISPPCLLTSSSIAIMTECLTTPILTGHGAVNAVPLWKSLCQRYLKTPERKCNMDFHYIDRPAVPATQQIAVNISGIMEHGVEISLADVNPSWYASVVEVLTAEESTPEPTDREDPRGRRGRRRRRRDPVRSRNNEGGRGIALRPPFFWHVAEESNLHLLFWRQRRYRYTSDIIY